MRPRFDCVNSSVYRLERNIVIRYGIRPHARAGVALVVAGIGPLTGSLTTLATALTAVLVSTPTLAAVSAALVSAAASAQKLKVGGDDFRGILGLAVFFPASGLKTPLHINGAAFGQVFLTDLRLLSKNHNAVPFGPFLALA